MERVNTLNRSKVKVFDTWLEDRDIERIWKVIHGELPLEFCSKEEMDEFSNIIEQAGKNKWKSITLQ